MTAAPDPSRSDGAASLPFAVHLRPGRTTRATVASTSEPSARGSGVGPSVARTSVRLPAQEWWVRATHP